MAATAVTFWVRNHPFFWDTVQLASKHAHFFYETGFQSLILPEGIDSGHPPAFGMYLAAVWKIFGKTLPVSHFAMLPFLWSIVFFLLKIGEKIAAKPHAPWLVMLCFADPVLASQSVLVSPDLALVCFFLMGLWAVLEQKNRWLIFAILGLGIISMRGMMVGAGLYLFSLFTAEKLNLKKAVSKMIPFLPGGLIAAGYLFYHWQQTGWIGYHENSTWAPSFERVDLKGFLKNLAVLAWRMLDFGRVFVWLVLAVIAYVLLKNEKWRLPKLNRRNTGWQLVGLFFILFTVLAPSQLLYKGLLAHRYLLPVFLSMNLFIFYLLFQIKPIHLNPLIANSTSNNRRVLCVLIIAAFLSGNLWIYPKKISQGWDSTLAHLPWYGLQEQAEAFILNESIEYQQVGTAFPNIGMRENIELNGVGEGFIQKDLTENCFVLYSNIMNDFTDEEIDELEMNWTPVFQREKRGVCVILYKKPNAICEK